MMKKLKEFREFLVYQMTPIEGGERESYVEGWEMGAGFTLMKFDQLFPEVK